ncbi:MAG: glycosyltransferase [Magnetococcales bacterium]|nr:glycosyltransferase [Magnetococcales bacterium]
MPAEHILSPNDPRYRLLEKELFHTLGTNLDCLDKNNPDLAKKLRAKKKTTRLDLRVVMVDGKMTSLILNLGNYQSFEMMNPNMREGIEERVSQMDIKQTVPLIFGVESGYEFLVLNDFTRLTDSISRDLKIERPVYVVEPVIERLLVILCMFDLCSIFQEGRFFFFVGTNALKEFAEYLIHPDVMLPNTFICAKNDENLARMINDLIRKCLEFRKENIRRHIEQVQSYYRSLQDNHWSRIYRHNPDRPLRILGLTSRFTTFLQYATRDMLDGFKQLGHETKIVIESHGTHRINTLSTFKAFSEFKPDMIFMMDHFRWEHDFRFMDRVPVVTWIQDALENIVTDRTDITLTDRDFVFCFSDLWLRDGTFDRPIYRGKKIHFLPVGINTNVFHPEPEISKDIDVLFVTHLVNPIRTLLPFRNPSWDPGLIGKEPKIGDLELDATTLKNIYFSLIAALDSFSYQQLCHHVVRPELLQELGRNIFQANGIAPHLVPPSFLSGIESPICMEVLSLIKAIPMIHLQEHGIDVHIYGKNWERFSQLGPRLKGPANNGQELNRLMNRSRICINNSAGTSLHMRALEILGSGNFLLTRRIPKKYDTASILDHFTENEDFVFFEDEADLLDKTRYFLEHESLRQEIATKGYHKACQTFGYNSLARNILDVINQELTRASP